MYITVKNMNKTLGKWVEYNDLYIGIPLFIAFLIIFSFTNYKLFSFILSDAVIFAVAVKALYLSFIILLSTSAQCVVEVHHCLHLVEVVGYLRELNVEQ